MRLFIDSLRVGVRIVHAVGLPSAPIITLTKLALPINFSNSVNGIVPAAAPRPPAAPDRQRGGGLVLEGIEPPHL
jgi:hypothetical protein